VDSFKQRMLEEEKEKRRKGEFDRRNLLKEIQ